MDTPFTATPIHLHWTKSRVKGRHELFADGPILGSLQRVGFWKSVTQAEFKGQAWSFRRNGCASTEILQEPGARPVARFRANWLGGGTLTFPDGQQFQLVAKGFWRPVWSWVNVRGQKLLEVTPCNKTVSLTTLGAGAWQSSENRLPVLIMFSWHQILQTNDDAAAAVAVSVAAG